jgi:hypothetical protein
LATEDEVLQINSITKRRVSLHCGDRKGMAYPERHVSTDHRRKFGDGYLGEGERANGGSTLRQAIPNRERKLVSKRPQWP